MFSWLFLSRAVHILCSPRWPRTSSRLSRYNETPDCHYESAELNFALHLRMGDRRDIEQATSEYFQLLDNFMEAVTEGVVRKGQAEPTFHVFSETLFPCPFAENGTFPEFPAWPVEMDQVRSDNNPLTLLAPHSRHGDETLGVSIG